MAKMPVWEQCKINPELEEKRRAGIRKIRCKEHTFEKVKHLGGRGYSLRCKVCGKQKKAWGLYSPQDYPGGGRPKRTDDRQQRNPEA